MQLLVQERRWILETLNEEDSLTVRIIEADNDITSTWDSIVGQSLHGTIFHTLNWLKIVEKRTNSRLYLLAGLKGEEVIGVFPVFRQDFMHSLLRTALSPHGNSFIPYLGPLFLNFNAYKQDKKELIVKDFVDASNLFLRRKMNPNYVSIMSAPGLTDVRSYQWGKYDVTPRYTYVKDIIDIESAWVDFKKVLRKNILNAEKKGVVVREGGKQDLHYIFSAVSNRLSKQELNIGISKDYFLDLYESFYPRNLNVFIAEYGNERVGGIITICFKDKLSVWFGAAQSDFGGFYPNDLLHWSIIKWANKQGFKKFEIIGANSPTISFFKSKYNLNLELYFSVSKYSSWFVKYAKSAYTKALLPVLFRLRKS
ncbi:MAG: GNAT family N-acetyltransferase [Candidatus Bathyarchaeia archaeon]|jgi:hypothetical protein